MTDIDVFEHPVVIGYPVGSGGNRLRRYLLGVPWDIEPQTHLHRITELRKYSTEDGVPKFPRPGDTEVAGQEFSKYPVLTTHGMNSTVLRQAFPGRKIVKVYCDLHLAMRRHWRVYSREMTQENIRKNNGGAILPQDIQRFIRWNLDYYRDNIDFEQDYAVYLQPGQGEFEDFMHDEFTALEESDFDQAWQVIAEDPEYNALANLFSDKMAMLRQEKP